MLSAARRGTRLILLDLPARVLRDRRLRAVVMSWPVQLGYAYVLKPLLLWCILALRWPVLGQSPPLVVSGVMLISLIINSRAGQAVEQAMAQVPASLYAALTAGLIPGFVRWVLWLFKSVLGLAEYAAHSVDEWLRFRSGDNKFGRALRGVLGVLWFPVGWLARFYLIVLIEPGFNPVKAPLSIIAAKFVYPLLIASGLWDSQTWGLENRLVMWAFVFATLWLSPDAITFLVWETKENWALYRANRPAALRPVPVGRHGETVKGLLRPGFHSGTVPRLYSRLRAAEARAAEEGDWRAVRANRQELHEAAAAVRKFLERELVALLNQCDSWRGRLKVVGVTLATNAIRIEIQHGAHPDSPLHIAFSQRGGWLMGGLHGSAWMSSLTTVEKIEFGNALSGLYKRASVDLVREQVLAGLPAGFTTFELEPDRLAIHSPEGDGRWLWYDLTRLDDRLRAENVDGTRASGPALDAGRLVFRRVELTLAEWEDAWRPDSVDGELPQLTAAAAAMNLFPAEELSLSHPRGAERIRSNGEAPLPAVAERNGAN
jgi:hypothetical protein